MLGISSLRTIETTGIGHEPERMSDIANYEVHG